MIYCPKCGAANRDGSRFCNECGEILGTQTQVKCPHCGAMNPVQNLFCTDCMGRLLPPLASTPGAEATPSIKGLSLPTKAAMDEQEEEPTFVSTTEPGDGVPAWLRELGASLSAEAQSSEPTPLEDASEIPDWLLDLRASLPVDSEDTYPARGSEAVPDWLTESPSPAADEESEPTVKAEEEAMPGWLAEFRSTTIEPEPVSEVEAGEIPDWLAELQSSATDETAAPAELESEAGAEPDWLAGVGAAVIETEPEPEPGSSEEATPGWLPESQATPFEEEPLTAAPTGTTPPAPAAPEWLAELQQAVPEQAPSPPDEPFVEAESLDWLLTPGRGLGEEDFLAPAEIPAWLLALKPTELRGEGEEKGPPLSFEEPREETGLLTGLQGTLPVEMIIAQPRAMIKAEMLRPSITDTPQARFFSEIVGQASSTAPREIAPAFARVPALLPRWLVYVVLIAAVSVPLLLGTPLFARNTEPTPAVADSYQVIEALGSNAPVLVAFDYDPTTSGEMDALAQTLVGHLMDRGARVVVVSLLPAGPATAQTVLDLLVAERPTYADSYGQRYVNLGYLPGEATGIRLLSLSVETALPRDFYGTPLADSTVMDGLETIQDFDLIVELAATQDTLRWWIEQASTPSGIPLVTGVSASVDPLARPYYEAESKQLAGMVGGILGAATYETLSSGPSPVDETTFRLDSLWVGQLAFILLLLVGNGVYLLQRGSGRER